MVDTLPSINLDAFKKKETLCSTSGITEAQENREDEVPLMRTQLQNVPPREQRFKRNIFLKTENGGKCDRMCVIVKEKKRTTECIEINGREFR